MPARLLIIEDSKVFAQMLQTLVKQEHGFDSDIAESLDETQRLLHSKTPCPYFAAIVDLQLPDAPLGEAIDLVVDAKIPSIVFTGTADEATEEDLWRKNISDYAHKSSAHSVEHVVWMVKRLFDNRNKEVLIVDDSVVARKTMEKLLATQCVKVHSAASSEQALNIIGANPDICLAIVDCNMEGLDGFELTSKIRNQISKDSLEIIGVSSHGGRSNSARFLKAGADDFLLKPFIPEEFLCRINRAIDRLDQYQKLKELNALKNRFLSTAAHDIRGPLAAIHNASCLLQKKAWPDERKQTMLKMIEDNSFDMQALLNELLDFSVIESGQLKLNCESLNLSKIVKERIELYSSEAEAKEIQFNSELTADISLLADRIKIQQVVDNLLTNAIKYSPHKGSIQIGLKIVCEEIELTITDSGPGIPDCEKNKLFQPYQTISTQSTAGEKQTGLGLVIAKNIVDAHGGSIHYAQELGRGATFSLHLPLKNACTTDVRM